MQLEKVTVTIRPRSPWQAIDVGFLLAKKNYLTLLLLWLSTAIPFLVFCTLVAFFFTESPSKWTILLFWIGKPFYEPPLLDWISKALFGSKMSISNTLKELRKKRSFAYFWSLLRLRFSFFRSFTLPVILLEGLKGKERAKRLSLLRENSEVMFFLTLGGFLIELALSFSLVAILFWLVPEELRWINFGDFIFISENWLLFISYFIGTCLFAPFYVCAGFMIYISRRIELEAWDIEIGFKRIQQRLAKNQNGLKSGILSILFLLLAHLFFQPSPSYAEGITPESAKNQIEQVLEEKEFGEKIVKTRWKAKEEEKEKDESPWSEFFKNLFESLENFTEKFGPFLSLYGKFILCGVFAIFLAYLIIRYSKIKQWLNPNKHKIEKSHIPEVMFGMNIQPESLPDDIPATCHDLLNEEKVREAMSLLYRGTLSSLLTSSRLELLDSFTENECCHEVHRSIPGDEAIFFDELTSVWIMIAYGHRIPAVQSCSNLVEKWQTFYGGD